MSRTEALLLALVLLACREHSTAEELSVTRLRSIPVPANDPSKLCSDVGDARVCWSQRAGEGVWVAERVLPGPNPSDPAKYRCTGSGPGRECRLRNELAPPFQCRGARCTQASPRLPDDGEWECADLGGAVLCRGGAQPSGVTRPAPDPGWYCGARRRGSDGDRICLDLDPDFPPGRGAAFRCRYEIEGAKLSRLCETSTLAQIGSRCQRSGECPLDLRCVSGICLPESFSPNCWGDADCAPARCAYGMCTARPR